MTSKAQKLKAKRDPTMDRIETVERYVENPNFSRDHDEGKAGNVRLIKVRVNVRESAIATLAQKKGALDGAQIAAADKFRAYWEAQGGAGARAIDFTREAVDGGRAVQDITDARMNAGLELKKCRAILGEHGYHIIRQIAGERRSLHEICGNRRERETTADMLRIHLTRLAQHWQLSTPTLVIESNGMRIPGALSKKPRKSA